MLYIHWTIVALYIIVVAASVVAVLMDNRQPSKTVAWVLVLTFLPVAGIVL